MISQFGDSPLLPKQFDSAERDTGRPAGAKAVSMQLSVSTN